MLKYLHEKGCPWHWQTCHYAARWGHLEVLKYAHENGCPWDEETCLYAAKGRGSEALKYLRENGCPEYEGDPYDYDFDRSSNYYSDDSMYHSDEFT